MADHFQQAAAGVMILFMDFQVFGQLIDTSGQNGNLNLRTGRYYLKMRKEVNYGEEYAIYCIERGIGCNNA